MLCACWATVASASAQIGPDGYVSLTIDALPNAPRTSTELRARLFASETVKPREGLTLHVGGFVEGLLGDRDRPETVRDAIVQPQEIYLELAAPHSDLRLGYSRIVWGTLDEIQPMDVVNPLDLARFVFEGRSEARLPVAMARGRVFFGERATAEAIIVPWFRRGRFDQLDEPSSPFNLEADAEPPIVVEIDEPGAAIGNLQGGGRFSATTGRVDWSLGAYRGFRPFGSYELLPFVPGQRLRAVRTFPRYTMIGGSFETAAGDWGWRGEIAATRGSDPETVDAGVGFDRGAGKYRFSGSVVVHRDTTDPYTSLSLVVAADRTFRQQRYRTRSFVVYNATEEVVFARNITAVELRNNLALEGSVGWFFGSPDAGGRDVIASLADRDFVYVRMKVHF